MSSTLEGGNRRGSDFLTEALEHVRKRGRVERYDVCVLHRDDLRREYKYMPIEDVNLKHIQAKDDSEFRFSAFVMFIDKDGSTKLLKNKFGNPGIVV